MDGNDEGQRVSLASSSRLVLLEGTADGGDAFVEQLPGCAAKADRVANEDACLICLGEIDDRTVLPECQHSLFCFGCILRWIGIHRRCPLCSTAIGAYLIHAIHSETEYVRHRLPALCGIAKDDELEGPPVRSAVASSSRRNALATPAARRLDALERWQRQLSVRRRVYRQELYCRHIGSNRRSRLAPPPTPQTIAETPSLRALLLRFLRRELLAFPIANLDVEFTSTYALNVFRTLEIKSDEAVGLLHDFLTLRGAQHFCHETYCFVRFVTAGAGSYPDKISAFDEWAAYDWPEAVVEKRISERQLSSTPANMPAKDIRSQTSPSSLIGSPHTGQQDELALQSATSSTDTLARRERSLKEQLARRTRDAAVVDGRACDRA